MSEKYQHGKWPTSKISLYSPFSVRETLKIELELNDPDIRKFTKNIFDKIQTAKKNGLDDTRISS